jgi:hypothetical protein
MNIQPETTPDHKDEYLVMVQDDVLEVFKQDIPF